MNQPKKIIEVILKIEIKGNMKHIFCLTILSFFLYGCKTNMNSVRIATFNTSLYRKEAGMLGKDLATKQDSQAVVIAEIIQRAKPDVLLLQEFDYSENSEYLLLFKKNYLEISQNGANAIEYPYAMSFPSNTGIPTGLDLDGNALGGTANDAYGYGAYPGQYAFSVLSKFPIDTAQLRSFQKFLWKDMPNAYLPFNPKDSSSYYSPEALAIFRLSSKNHVDIPIQIGGNVVHLLASHPTPPVFDGPEDRNGKRNHDEIRLWADYIANAPYLYDDRGKTGGLPANTHFVIAGDLNADPLNGDSYGKAADLVIKSPFVNKESATGLLVPQSAGSKEMPARRPYQGNLAHRTSTFGLRVDYVLPSATLKAVKSGIFWPAQSDSLARLVGKDVGSDHRLVWIDLLLRTKK